MNFAVDCAVFKKFVVGTGSDEASVIQYENPIRVGD